MKPLCLAASLLLVIVALTPARTDDQKKDGGFVPMFDGKSLKGWVNVNCHPNTFFVKNNEIITTGKPTGYLRTEKQYENFIAEFEWKHIPPKPGEVGNSGFFVWADPLPAVGSGYTRGIEVQVLVNLTYKNKKGEITATSQGDLFSIWGATCVPDRPHPDGWARCLPSENHCKGEGEWNHYRVEAKDGVIKLAVNGHVVSGLSKCKPRKGYLALESEGSECHFRNLKIKELPSSNPKKDEIADAAQGHKSLFFGDLTGWKADAEANRHWQAKDYVLHYDGKGKELRLESQYGDAEYSIDFRFPEKGGADNCKLQFRTTDKGGLYKAFDRKGREEIGGWYDTPDAKWSIGTGLQPDGKPAFLKPAGQWNRLRIDARASKDDHSAVTYTINGSGGNLGDGLRRLPKKGYLILSADGEMDFANLFVRELK
jgi:hypothetical protein